MQNMKFITFEGGEGTGKSTQAALLFAALQERKIPCILTREPGGSPGAELIRKLLVKGSADRWDAYVETLLLVAARRDHWFHTIEPALKAGQLVLCDRFIDSTLVYQGYTGGLEREFLEYLHTATLPACTPDRTYVFDCDPALSLKRARNRLSNENRFEEKQLSYHQQIRQGYLQLSKQHLRYLVLDTTTASAQMIHQQILKDLEI